MARSAKSFVNDDRLLPIEEAAEIGHVGKGVIYREIRAGRLGCVRVGRKILIPASALDDYLNRQYQPASSR